jgi:hypothetical protein
MTDLVLESGNLMVRPIQRQNGVNSKVMSNSTIVPQPVNLCPMNIRFEIIQRRLRTCTCLVTPKVLQLHD